ncbi:aldolase [Opitutaceae bacterium TAV5]|nr:aldolase [Opitutaceae bacterium TAV5]
MKLRSSRLLSALRSGQSTTLFKLNLTDPAIVEVAGVAGASTLWLCNEHVPNDWLNLANQIRAARIHNMDTMVRVARGSYSDYVKPFEADATGIMVPHVTTADEARQIVAWTRFRPVGRRALDGGNIDGRFCQVLLPDYLDHSNRERFVVLQIESPEALENVEAIAAVPGFDLLLFGAGDFSHLVGKPGEMQAPEVVAARKRIAAAAVKHGKWAALAGLPAPRAELEAEGYRVFGIGADVIGLHNYVRDQLASFESAPSMQVQLYAKG